MLDRDYRRGSWVNKGKIIFYSTPAYGHISASFEIMRAYVEYGYQVIFYSTESFREAIEKTGVEYRAYNFDESRLDLTVGNKILKLEDTILSFTSELADGLIQEARSINPDMIFHDNVAMWGRVVAKTLNVHTVCIHSFPIVPSLFSQGMLAYTKQFGGLMWKDMMVMPHIIKMRKLIHKKYPGVKLSLLSDTLNHENTNIFTFPKFLQPGYRKLKDKYYFLGPGLLNPDYYYGQKASDNQVEDGIIFVSLGTVFQNNINLYKKILDQFKETAYPVLISMSKENEQKLRSSVSIPSNVKICNFVKQGEVLDHAILYIGAGGMNSVCQAVHRRVPCLLFPQQGEQHITAERIQRMGLGRLSRDFNHILIDAEKLLKDYHPDERFYHYFEKPDFKRMIRYVEKRMR